MGAQRAYGAATANRLQLQRMVGAAAFAGAGVLLLGGLPVRFPAEIRPVLATMNYLNDDIRSQARVGRCGLTADTPIAKYAPECRTGDTLIWGDSYSALLGTGLPKPYGQFSANGCLPIVRNTTEQCAVINRDILAEIMKRPPKRVILYGAWSYVNRIGKAANPFTMICARLSSR